MTWCVSDTFRNGRRAGGGNYSDYRETLRGVGGGGGGRETVGSRQRYCAYNALFCNSRIFRTH